MKYIRLELYTLAFYFFSSVIQTSLKYWTELGGNHRPVLLTRISAKLRDYLVWSVFVTHHSRVRIRAIMHSLEALFQPNIAKTCTVSIESNRSIAKIKDLNR